MAKEQPANNNCNTDCPLPGKVNPQATALNYAVKFTSHHYFWPRLYYCWNNNMESTSWNWSFGESWCTWAGSVCGENNRRNSGGYWRRGHFIWPWSNYCADHCQDYWANTVHCWKKTKTQLNRGAAKAKIAETQNATLWPGGMLCLKERQKYKSLDASCYCLSQSLYQSYQGWNTWVDSHLIFSCFSSIIVNKLNNWWVMLLWR